MKGKDIFDGIFFLLEKDLFSCPLAPTNRISPPAAGFSITRMNPLWGWLSPPLVSYPGSAPTTGDHWPLLGTPTCYLIVHRGRSVLPMSHRCPRKCPRPSQLAGLQNHLILFLCAQLQQKQEDRSWFCVYNAAITLCTVQCVGIVPKWVQWQDYLCKPDTW